MSVRGKNYGHSPEQSQNHIGEKIGSLRKHTGQGAFRDSVFELIFQRLQMINIGGLITVVLLFVNLIVTVCSVQAANANQDFIDAVMAGNWAEAKRLSNDGADVNFKNNIGLTALMEASSSGNIDALEFLIRNGANIEETDKDGETALMFASTSEAVDFFIDNGANINARDVYGFTAIFWAAARGRMDVVKALLARGADIKTRDRNGNSVLKGASKGAHVGILKLLKAHGAED